MKTYKGLLNVPTTMSSKYGSIQLNRKIKIIGLPYNEFIEKYMFITKRTLRGYIIEAINIIFMVAIFYAVSKVMIDAIFNQDEFLAIISLVVYLYMLFSPTLFRSRTIYERYNAEYYIDIERRK